MLFFGMPQTVKKIQYVGFAMVNLRRLLLMNAIKSPTPTIKSIIEEMRASNPNLRVVGLSATPYRLNDGYIYAYDEFGNPVPSDQTKDPLLSFYGLSYYCAILD